MNVEIYGIKESDDLLKNVNFVKLISGENLICYCSGSNNGVVSFLPYEIKEEKDDFILVPFLPYIKEKLFYLAYDNIQFLKKAVMKPVEDKYRTLTEMMFKKDIEDLMFSCQRVKEAEEQSMISTGAVTLH